MIKIKIKNKLLSESKDLKYPSLKLVKDIMKFGILSKKSLKPSSVYFDVPLKQIIYSKNKKVMLGLPYLYHYHILNHSSYYNEADINYSKSILKMNLPLKVTATFNPKAKSIALSGSATINNKSMFLIYLFLNKIKTGSFKNILIHELQHLTQRVNDICLFYGEQLVSLDDPKKMQMVDIKDIPNKFGLGSDKTGILKTTSPTDVFATAAGDVEYETYLTQLVNSYYNRLLKNKAQIKSEVDDMGPERAAMKYIKDLFHVLINDPAYANTKGIIDKIMEKRPKELPKDMLSLLTNRLRKI